MNIHTKKILRIFLAALIIIAGSADGIQAKKRKAANTRQHPTSNNIRQQRQQTQAKIKETDEEIRRNNRIVASQLNQLNQLNAEVSRCNADIKRLTERIDSIDRASAAVNDSIEKLTGRLDKMRSTYATALRNSRRARASVNTLAFVFSSDNFTQAIRRMRTLKQFSKWRTRKAGEISRLTELLSDRRAKLDSLAAKQHVAMNELSAHRSTVVSKQNETSKLVADLKSKDKQLRRVLDQQRRKAAQLDKELDRLIAEEQRAAEERRKKEEAEALRRKQQAEAEKAAREKAEQQKREKSEQANPSPTTPEKPKKDTKRTKQTPDPTKSDLVANNSANSNIVYGAKFGENKGKLPYPVEGEHTVVKHFGRQRHPDFPNIEIDNSGIDIQTVSGATVRCVFDGEVSAIFCPDGYNNVVVVRHGEYVTVYANLGTLNVRKGDKVNRSQTIGTVYVDGNDSNRSILHFEIRNATNANNIRKENPEAWLR